MNFETLFDASHQGSEPIWVQLIFSAAGALFVFRPYLPRRHPPSNLREALRAAFFWGLFTFPLLSIVAGFISTILSERVAETDLEDRHFSVIEGPVIGFHPAPHAEQSFIVAGHRFSCPDALAASDFQRPPFYGSPIHDGLHVRITYSGNLILRLEVAR